MKILIVDDSLAKVKRLIAYLTTECGVARDDVVVVNNAFDARTHLRAEQYDLLILDIVLPLRQEDDPRYETSLELLKEITERDGYHKPGRVIGTTAYGDLADKAAPFFLELAWTVIKYDETSDEWLASVGGCVRYVAGQQAQRKPIPAYGVDVCIVTALEEPEMEAIHRLPWSWEGPTPIDDATFIRSGTFSSGGRQFKAISAVAPRMGMVSAALLTATLTQLCRPRFIIMAGICAGVRGKSKIGDILFADATWDWQSGKRVRVDNTPDFDVDPHFISPPEWVNSRATLLRNDQRFWDEVRREFPGAPQEVLRLHVGAVASGSAVLADGKLVADITKQKRSMLGVEMEVYGVYAAAEVASRPRPTAFAFKSVCDFANEKKSDEYRQYAAYTSARAVREFCERYMHEIIEMVPN